MLARNSKLSISFNNSKKSEYLLMKKFVKNLALNFLSIGKIHPARLTDKNELQALLTKLRPISCGKELIRLGPNGDGGYLVPDDLEGIKTCFSLGVGSESGFELDCANRGMNVFLADQSVEKLPDSHEKFRFTKKNISVTTNDDFMTLDDWVASSIPDSQDELLLQIDIEGYEYEVFLGASDQLLKRFRIIVAEFHQLDQLWNKPFFNLTSRVFYKLIQTHCCVHNHPNNHSGSIKRENLEIPRITELTFQRNDRVNNPSFINTFPHPLDCDNSRKPPLYLPKCWYT
jgi:FkbM family methyltransferase